MKLALSIFTVAAWPFALAYAVSFAAAYSWWYSPAMMVGFLAECCAVLWASWEFSKRL